MESILNTPISTPSRLGLLAWALMACAAPASHAQVPEVPPLVAGFHAEIGDAPDNATFRAAMQNWLWKAWVQGEAIKPGLVEYVRNGSGGPPLALAVLAIAGYHDPADAIVIADRALDRETDPISRWYLLHALPQVLSIGGVAPPSNDGSLNPENESWVTELRRKAIRAEGSNIGNVHAGEFRKLFDLPDAAKAANPQYETLLWFFSSHLAGSLNLADYDLLSPALDPTNRLVFGSLMNGLSLAAGTDFLVPLRAVSLDSLTPEMEQDVAESARKWWEDYVKAHPDGNWIPAVLQSLRDAGYEVTDSPGSPESLAAIRSSLRSENKVLAYGSCRLLNSHFRTGFHLDWVFLGDKFSKSPLGSFYNMPGLHERLLKYWEDRIDEELAKQD